MLLYEMESQLTDYVISFEADAFVFSDPDLSFEINQKKDQTENGVCLCLMFISLTLPSLISDTLKPNVNF